MATKPVASHVVDVPARADRLARHATLDVRAVEVTLLLSKRRADRRPEQFVVRVVSAQERNPPRGAKALNWVLFTNASIDTAADARAVIAGYAMRWRIEEFHRTWKAGACDVECTQLRTRDAVIRWATVLGVIAARVERIKRLGRTEPTRPATDEFSEVELRVLIALKRRIKKRAEVVPDGVPTIAQAARWLADLGGYLGTSPTRPPGAVPIARGLERLQHGVEAVLALDK